MENDLITCEVCGKQKTRSEMSKSYPHRCKECVAEHTRQVRADAKQNKRYVISQNDRPFNKAVVKDTGETVLVRMFCEPLTVRTAMYETPEGRMFPMFALEHKKEIDWEQRRYELIRDFYLKWTSIEDFKNDAVLELRFNEAIKSADALINRLKEEQNEDNL